MPIELYSFKLRRMVPLLTEEEYAPIDQSPRARLKRIQHYSTERQVSLEEALKRSDTEALDYYENLTGVRLPNPYDLYWVSLSRYGRICPSCGRPFRTPRAKICAECGFELPYGEVAGPATLP